MKKKSFLASVTVLAVSMAIDANAALPDSLTEKLNSSLENSIQEQNAVSTVQSPFVLTLPNSISSTDVANHYSHRSHASHSSHVSSR